MRTKTPLKLDRELNVYFLRMSVCSIFLLWSNEKKNQFQYTKAFSDVLPQIKNIILKTAFRTFKENDRSMYIRKQSILYSI